MSVDGIRLGEFQLIESGIAGAGHKRYIGERFICRFCGRSRESVDFKKKAHAIPEFLGNHQLILNSECDSCNEYFGNTIEPHLEKYTHPFRTLTGVTNKARKTPKHCDEKIDALQFDRHTNHMTVVLNDDVAFRHHDNHVSWVMQRKPFVPYMAYKALCKIAASVANDRYLPLFKPTLEWLNPLSTRELSISPTVVIETLTPGTRYTSCVYRLYFRNTNTFPHCLFWIAFGSYALMTFVPTWLDFGAGVALQSKLPYVPDIRSEEEIARFGQQLHTERDFSSRELTSFSHEVHMRFESIEEEAIPPE
ncbi:HNH endonuclease [Azotobacter beijerinckii]|uniref:HNH endonuclease n=1 Tax=Azotobacter beijerinckii TaxID=170623 RepID=A0A1H9M573_9GAMM|nr:HNH endonuclease [Azotobacter beijerinckii]SER18878.1 HNH endonuclease [Azotobacter beijerinckii]